jgi:hypothetical protein
MRRHVFLRIVRDVENFDRWFSCRPDATGKMGRLEYIVAHHRLRDRGEVYHKLMQDVITHVWDKFGGK